MATAIIWSLVSDLPFTRITVDRSVDFDRRSESSDARRLLSVADAARSSV